MRIFLWRAALAGIVLLAGCSGSHSVVPSMGNSASFAKPQVIQNGTKPINWTQFTDISGFGNTYAIAVGSDKNIWLGNNAGGLMRVGMTGAMKLFPLTYTCSGTSKCNFVSGYGMVVGKDGKFYLGGSNYDYNTSHYVLGVATTTGTMSFHDLKLSASSYVGNAGLTVGPDGNVWFVEQAGIGKITTTGALTEFAYKDAATSNSYGSIATGSDGNLWVTEYNSSIIDKVVPSTGTMTEFSLSSLGCNPSGIASASDGNLYFYCNGYLGQITTSGALAKFYDPYGVTYLPQGMIKGTDGNIWFPSASGAYINEYNPMFNSFTTYIPPYTSGTIYQMVLGPDNNYWAAESSNKIDVYINDTLVVSPSSVTFSAVGQTQNLTVKEPNTSAWTDTSTNPGVCTVVQGGSANVFKATAAGLGTSTITIKDKIGNSFNVKCKVT